MTKSGASQTLRKTTIRHFEMFFWLKIFKILALKHAKSYSKMKQKLKNLSNLFQTSHKCIFLGGAVSTTFSKIFFFQKIDFWATTWSEDAQNIFLESLEGIFKVNFEQNLKKLQTDFFRGNRVLFFCFKWIFMQILIVLNLDTIVVLS